MPPAPTPPSQSSIEDLFDTLVHGRASRALHARLAQATVLPKAPGFARLPWNARCRRRRSRREHL